MGQEEGLPERLGERCEAQFPNLVACGYYVTSPRSYLYNCIAYAAGDETRKWDCGMLPLDGYYWPQNVLPGGDTDALVRCFTAIGFEVCSDDCLEDGYEKVALYADNWDQWLHAAKQLSDGWWSSKLGDSEDIRHRTPYGLCGTVYGQVSRFMRRRIRSAENEEAG